MRIRTIYIDKKTNEKFGRYELYEKTRKNFKTDEEWEKWVQENYDEKEIFVESPYERTRNMVYATGNKWAIENFNATH